jgi:hypothetical protein
MSNPAQREELVFTGALDLPAQYRAAYLKTACGGDLQLLAQVKALFQALGQPVGVDRRTKAWKVEREQKPVIDRRCLP